MVGQKENLELLKLVNKLLSMLEDQDSFVFIKDTNHQYLGCNDRYAHFLGLENNTAINGLTDSIINPQYADIYFADDNKVLHGDTVYINNPANFKGTGPITVSGKIVPIFDDFHQVAGILGRTCLVDSIANRPFAQAIALLTPSTIPLLVQKNYYLVNTRYGIARISKREVQCILFLFKSLTSDDIANNLQLSRRSVESYFVNIKNKLNVHHKSEILEVVILGGLLEQL